MGAMKRETGPIKIQEIAHHRNGVGGEPFYVVRFRNAPYSKTEEHEFIAILFEQGGYCAVIAISLIDSVGVAFAGGNSWRGDVFEPELRDAIAKWEKQRDLALGLK